jgi:hypothetical protein
MNTICWATRYTSIRWIYAALLLGVGIAITDRAIAHDSIDADDIIYGDATNYPAKSVSAGNPSPWATVPSRWTGSITFGLQQWPALGELDTEPFGEFEETGFNISGSIHRRMRHLARGELLFGGDMGWMIHESNITAPGDWQELVGDIIFLTPSAKWTFGGGRRETRFSLEAGVGLYWTLISEFLSDGGGIGTGTRHYEEYAPGGYVGMSLDVPVRFLGDVWAINVATRVHYADFDDVDAGAFGKNLGSLSGPIASLQLGMTYDW